MKTSDTGDVLSPIEFKIRGLEQKAEEVYSVLMLLLDTMGLTVVRSIRNPKELSILSIKTEKGGPNDDSKVSKTAPG